MENMVKFNINSYVHFKLTDIGLQKLKDNHDDLNEWAKGRLGSFRHPHVDENGFCEMQLWSFINNFGSLMGCGFDSPVECCEIYFDKKDLK